MVMSEFLGFKSYPLPYFCPHCEETYEEDDKVYHEHCEERNNGAEFMKALKICKQDILKDRLKDSYIKFLQGILVKADKKALIRKGTDQG